MDNRNQPLIGAQESVIGSILIDARCLPVVLERVKPDYFTVSQYRTIFNAIRDLAGTDRPVDPVTVLDRVGREYENLLAQLIQITPTAANIKEYCKILKREARLKLLKDAASEIMLAADEDDIIASLDNINAVMVDKPGVRCMNMAQALEDFYRRHDPKVTPNFLPWYFKKLNKFLRVAPGEFVLIGGYPSDGKTTLALATAREQARTKRVGFFSLETDCEKLTDAMVCAAAQIGLPKIQMNAMSANDWDTLACISDDFADRNLEIIEAAGMTVTDIRLYSMAHHYDVVYIDYIQLIPASGKSEWAQQEYNRVSANSRDLKLFGLQCGVTVVALSQMTRPPRNKDGKIPPPTMSSLRSSGQLEQDAAVILLMFRENQNKNDCDRIITIGKNKTGESGGSFTLEFDGKMQTFSEKGTKQKNPKEEIQAQTELPGFREVSRDLPVPFEK